MVAKKPTTINGVTYPSRAEAAKALGLKPDSIRESIRLGRLSRTGTKEKFRPIKLKGETYPSIAAAARELNLPVRQIYILAKNGQATFIEN
jgi:hypothetical protein